MPIPSLKIKSPQNWKNNRKQRREAYSAKVGKRKTHIVRNKSGQSAKAHKTGREWRLSQRHKYYGQRDSNLFYFLRQRFWKYTLRLVLGVGLLLIIVGGIIFLYYSSQVPSREDILATTEGTTTKIYDRTGKILLYDFAGNVNRTWVNLDRIPQQAKWALIAMEDDQFYSHNGFDLPGLFKAFLHEAFGIGPPRGGSTITQQLVKNALLTPEHTYRRKIKELVLAYQLEKKFSKDEILELYFNVVPYGSTAYGIEAASELYFGKPVDKLDLAESAILAAMLKATTYYSPYGSHVDKLFARQHLVLDKMLKLGYITSEQAAVAKAEKVKFKKFSQTIKAPHFVFYIKELLAAKYGDEILEKGGLKVITTLDWPKQQLAEEAIKEGVEKNERKYGAHNAALASIDAKTGEVLAMVGSRNYFNEKYDGAVNVTMRPRQPGSSFKPIVYAALFMKGYSPKTILFDTLTKFKTDTGQDYEPHNYNDHEFGPVNIRQALAGSLNIPAVKAIYLAGIDNVLNLAERMGYTTFQDRSRFGLSLVLGGGEVKLIDHVRAFAAFADNGKRHSLHYLLKVEDRQGKILEEFDPNDDSGEEIIDPQIAKEINSVLSDDDARAYIFGKGSYLTLPNRPVAAKTGTTNDYRDGWTIGYTPSIVTGVWVGNNDNSPMHGAAAGGNVAAPIWHNYMQAILKDQPVEKFDSPEPQELPQKPMLNGKIGEEKIVKIDKASGKLATDLTPASFIIEKRIQELHCILHYVNKDNPLGPVPEHPEKDPQYNNWEEAVKTWAKENNKIAPEDLPKEFDDVHILENKPAIKLLVPKNGQHFTQPILQTQVRLHTPRTISRVEYYLDDQLLASVKKSPYNLNDYQLLGLSNGEHWLRAIAYDDIDNSQEDKVKIYLDLEQKYSQPLIWLQPSGDGELYAEQLPYKLKVKINNYNRYKKIDFYYKPVDGSGSSVWIGWSEIKVDEVSVNLEDIKSGDYEFYALLTDKNGHTIQSQALQIRIVD